MNDHAIPDLRAAARKPRMTTGMSAMVRHLDADGTFEAGRTDFVPGTGLVAHPKREDVIDAETLVEMICVAVREEVARLLVDAGVIKPTGRIRAVGEYPAPPTDA